MANNERNPVPIQMFNIGVEESSMAKVSPHALKGIGYVISTVSVIMLAVVSWKSASQDPLLAACLFGGAATSIAGMCCRWTSYAIEKRQNKM